MTNEKKVLLDTEKLNDVVGGKNEKHRLYFVDRFGGDQEAGPFHTEREARVALEEAQRKEPNVRFVITYTVA